jgi:hypothetical protein
MFEFTQYYNQRLEQANPYITTTTNNKIKLVKNNIRLQFYFCGLTQKGYKLSFIVYLITPTTPGQIRASQIDDVSLKKAIIDNIDEYDRNYMELSFFSTNKAEFYFNYNKWINDTLKDIDIQKELSIFNRKIKFKKALPKMVMYNSLRKGFSDFLSLKLREEILKRKLDKKKFIPFLPKEFVNFLGQKTDKLFNYEYDMQYNTLYVRLKPELVITASLLLAKVISDTKSDIKNNDLKDPKFFDASVKKMLTDKNWEMKINNKGK